MKKITLSFVLLNLMALGLSACSSNDSASLASQALMNSASAQDSKPQVDYRPIRAVPAQARTAVTMAYEARNRREWEQLPGYGQIAKDDHELGAYPMFWYWRQQLQDSRLPIDYSGVQQFIQSHPNSYVAERLTADLQMAGARRGEFNQVKQFGLTRLNASAPKCAYYQAQAATGVKVDKSEALKTFHANPNCWDMLRTLRNVGQIGFADLQAQMRDAVEYDNKANARQFAGLVFDAGQMRDYDAILANPNAWLAGQSGSASSSAQAELRAIAFSRLARQDRDMGIGVLQSRGAELLTPQNLQWAYTQFALIAVLNLEDRSDAWYRQGKAVPLSDYNAAWRVRAALRQPTIDWSWVKQTISYMNAEQQAETAWVYWRARADEALGNKQQAQQGYQKIEHELDFYGLLAQERLHGKIRPGKAAAPVTSAELKHIKQNTGLQKAVALFGLGWRPEAVAEWGHAIRGLNDRDLMAAAAWAEQEHIYDRVINTSSLTRHEISYAQRYLAPFEGRVGQQARSVGVDPAWVYGLIRQESRFVPVARSSVGASGLMQLMPGTARLVANKIGMSGFSPGAVNDFEVNTILGTNYLKMTMDDLAGSEVLATAGYNAGPNRAKRWRSSLSHPMEGAIFAETIPFTETRLYVKHVLSNAVWYQMHFSRGQPQSLQRRLGQISPW